MEEESRLSLGKKTEYTLSRKLEMWFHIEIEIYLELDLEVIGRKIVNELLGVKVAIH